MIMNPARGSLLGIEHLDAAEILRLLKFARRMNPDKPRPLLKSKRVFLVFYEASTRTRSSFEVAAKSLGAHTVLLQAAGSSIEKGESLLDTGYTVRAVGADIIVIRHPNAGAPYVMAQHIDVPSLTPEMGCTSIPRRRCSMLTPFCATRKRSKACRSRLSATSFTAEWRGRRATC